MLLSSREIGERKKEERFLYLFDLFFFFPFSETGSGTYPLDPAGRGGG
jgi:hypothetical protein